MAESAKSRRGGQRSKVIAPIGSGKRNDIVDKYGNMRSVIDSENKIKLNTTETAILIDNEGNIVFDKSDGKKDQVAFTWAETAEMAGYTLTHNHPNGSVFSPDDINLMVANHLKEVRATGSNGTFSLKKKETKKAPEMDPDYFAYGFGNNPAVRKGSEFRVKLDGKYNAGKAKYDSGEITLPTWREIVKGINTEVDKSNINWLKTNASKYGYKFTHEK